MDSDLFASPIVLGYGSRDLLGLDDHKEPNQFCFFLNDLIQSVCNQQSSPICVSKMFLKLKKLNIFVSVL